MSNKFPDGFRVLGGADYSRADISPVLVKAIAFLEKLPFRELLDSRTLALKISCAFKTFKDYTPSPAIQDYRVMGPRGKFFYGSKKTIREFKRLRDKQNED